MTDDKLRAALDVLLALDEARFDAVAWAAREMVKDALAASATDEGPKPAAADIRGLAPGMTGGLSSEEYVRSIRDARPAAPAALDVELENRVRRIVERTANMGGCSQTHHEHLASDASKVYAALSEPSDDRD